MKLVIKNMDEITPTTSSNAVSSEALVSQAPRPKKIVLLEDDLAIVDIYETILKKEGFEVRSCTLGGDVVRLVKDLVLNPSDVPDIFLLDYILPDISGGDVLAEIRKSEIAKNVKVFILSNESNVVELLPPGVSPDKIFIKADMTPSDLVRILREELGA